MHPSPRSKIALVLLAVLFAYNATAVLSSAGATDAADESDAAAAEEVMPAEEEPVVEDPVVEPPTEETSPPGEPALADQSDGGAEGATEAVAQPETRSAIADTSQQVRKAFSRLRSELRSPSNAGVAADRRAPAARTADHADGYIIVLLSSPYDSNNNWTTYTWQLQDDPNVAGTPSDGASHVTIDTCLGNAELFRGGTAGTPLDHGTDPSIGAVGYKWEASPEIGETFVLRFAGDTGTAGTANWWIKKGPDGHQRTGTTAGPKCTGTVRIAKDVTGAGSGQFTGLDFNFTGTVDGDTVADWSEDDGFQTFNDVTPGTYQVGETVPNTNWTLTGIACTTTGGGPDGNSTNSSTPGTLIPANAASINVSANETVTCTFTNDYDPGRIRITKTVLTQGAPLDTFNFSGAAGTPSLQAGGTSSYVEVTQGNKVLTEALPSSEWSLSDIDCIDQNGDIAETEDLPNRQVTVSVSAGQDVTCEFKNAYAPAPGSPSVAVTKTAVQNGPLTPPGASFDYDINGNDQPDITPGQTGSPVTAVIGQNTVQEDVGALPAGWTFTGADCKVGQNDISETVDTATGLVTFNAAADEDVVCELINTYSSGTLAVDKVVTGQNASTSQLFDFSDTSSAFDMPNISDANSPATSTFDVPVGAHEVTETISGPMQNEWTLTGIGCDDANSTDSVAGNNFSGIATFNIEANETVTCTFTNAFSGVIVGPGNPPPPPEKGKIVVDKITDPSGSTQSFGFTLTPQGGSATPFALTDAAIPFDSGDLDPGTYAVAETVPGGWDLTSATCSDGSSPAAVNLAANETVTCTFTNTQRGSIEAVLELIPSSGGTTTRTFLPRALADFVFAGDLAATLQNDGDSIGPIEVAPGVYQTTETVAAGWTLTKIDCVNDPTGGSSGNLPSATATFSVAPGEDVTCTFTNVQDEVKGGGTTDPGQPGTDDETDEPEVLDRPATALPLTGSDPVRLVAISALLILSGATAILYGKKRQVLPSKNSSS